MLKLHSSAVAVDEKELDVTYYKNSESSQKCLYSEIFYTLRDYTAQKDDELSFGLGMPLKVLHKSRSGWWTVRYVIFLCLHSLYIHLSTQMWWKSWAVSSCLSQQKFSLKKTSISASSCSSTCVYYLWIPNPHYSTKVKS